MKIRILCMINYVKGTHTAIKIKEKYLQKIYKKEK